MFGKYIHSCEKHRTICLIVMLKKILMVTILRRLRSFKKKKKGMSSVDLLKEKAQTVPSTSLEQYQKEIFKWIDM